MYRDFEVCKKIFRKTGSTGGAVSNVYGGQAQNFSICFCKKNANYIKCCIHSEIRWYIHKTNEFVCAQKALHVYLPKIYLLQRCLPVPLHISEMRS